MALTALTMRVVASGAIGSEVWANVWHVQFPGILPDDNTISDNEIDDVLDDFEDFYSNATVLGYQAASWNVQSLIASFLPPSPRDGLERSISYVGQSASDLLPQQLSVVLTHKTGMSGQSFRGRTYLAGWAENATGSPNAPRLLAAARDGIGLAARALQTALQSNGTQSAVGVYSRKLDVFNLTTSFRVGNTFDTQRRRRNKLTEAYSTF